jgi:multidrug efflux pump subunit AcrA (membrane-fusion protein)
MWEQPEKTALYLQQEQTALYLQQEQTALYLQKDQTALYLQKEQTALYLQQEQTALYLPRITGAFLVRADTILRVTSSETTPIQHTLTGDWVYWRGNIPPIYQVITSPFLAVQFYVTRQTTVLSEGTKTSVHLKETINWKHKLLY